MISRIITDGSKFKVQTRHWWNPFWSTVQRAEDFNNKDLGGDKNFNTKEEAQNYIDHEITENKWVVVK